MPTPWRIAVFAAGVAVVGFGLRMTGIQSELGSTLLFVLAAVLFAVAIFADKAMGWWRRRPLRGILLDQHQVTAGERTARIELERPIDRGLLLTCAPETAVIHRAKVRIERRRPGLGLEEGFAGTFDSLGHPRGHRVLVPCSTKDEKTGEQLKIKVWVTLYGGGDFVISRAEPATSAVVREFTRKDQG